MVEISKASKENIPEIANIHKVCVSETNARVYPKEVIAEWLEQISEENTLEQFEKSDWHILKLNGQIIGFSQISLPEKELYQLNILPKFQNKGYGQQLYKFIEEIFKFQKINQIGLNSTLNAVNFYESLGFKAVKSITFKSVEMVEMAKNL